MCGIKLFFMIMNQHTSQTQHKTVSPRKPSKSATNFCLDLAPQWVFFCFHIQRKASWGANSTAIQPWDLLFFFVWAASPKEDYNRAFELWVQDTQSKGMQSSLESFLWKDAGKTIALWSEWTVLYTDGLIQSWYTLVWRLIQSWNTLVWMLICQDSWEWRYLYFSFGCHANPEVMLCGTWLCCLRLLHKKRTSLLKTTTTKNNIKDNS